MIPITTQQALARLAECDPLEVQFEQVPNSGKTWIYKFPRAEAVSFIIEAGNRGVIEECGQEGQSLDFGFFLHFTHREPGRGWLFFQTRPEARLTREELFANECKAARAFMERIFNEETADKKQND